MADWTPPDKATGWTPPDKPSTAAAAPPPAAAEPEEKPGILPPAGAFSKGIAYPLINFASYPFRAAEANIYGMAKGGLPIDEPRREKFYEERQKALDATTLPESSFGQGVSKVLGFPGEMIGAAGRGLSRALLGPEETEKLGPMGTIAADTAALAAPGAAALRRRTAAPLPPPTPQAQAAHAAGYKIAPEEVGTPPTLTSRMLSGESGKWKKQQALSEPNQENTNRMAAKAIGLPTDTTLNDAAFARAEAPAKAIYNGIETAVPETALGGDPQFQKAVQGIGVRNQLIQRFFPQITHNPQIDAVRAELLHNDVAPTTAVIAKIQDLRMEAGQNFRKQNDNQAHALGFAQRQAANVLEDAVERSIAYGNPSIAAFQQLGAANRALAAAQAQSKSMAGGAGTHALAQAQQAVAAAQANLQAVMSKVNPADLQRANQMISRFKEARQLFARINDVKSATVTSSGDVIAKRLATLRRVRNRPLSGELKTIADAADDFPKDMQRPAAFGRLEDFSILDIVGAGTALAAGHPVAAGILGFRHPGRRMLTSDWYQNRMFNRQPFFTSPGAAAVEGQLAMPREDDPVARALPNEP